MPETDAPAPLDTPDFDAQFDAATVGESEGEGASETDATESAAAAEGDEVEQVAESGEGGETLPDAEAAAAEVEEDTKSDEPEGEGEGETPSAETEGSDKDELEEDLDQDEEIKPDSEDEKNLYFKKTKAHRLMESHADMKAIREKIPGATVEALEKHYQDSGVLARMGEDFDSGGIDGQGRFMEFWFGTAKGGNPEVIQRFSQALPVYLAKNNPPAFRAMENIVHDALVAGLYRRAGELKSSGTAGEKAIEQAFLLAENLEFTLRKTVTPRGQQPQQPQAADDREKSIAERERTMNEREASSHRQRVTATTQLVDQDIREADDAVIDEYLSKVEAKGVKLGERERKHIRRDLQEAIDDAAKSQTTWRQQFGTQRDAAIRRFSEENRKSLKAQRRQFAAPHVRRNLREVIAASTKTAVGASKRTHQQQAQAQGRRQGAPSSQRTSRAVDIGKEIAAGKMTWEQAVDAL